MTDKQEQDTAGETNNDAAKKLDLWFFRDLSGEQRGKLLALFGLHDKQKDVSHGYQRAALKQVLRALRDNPAHAAQVGPTEWDRTGATEWRGRISYVEWARADGVTIWLPNMLHPDQVSPSTTS